MKLFELKLSNYILAPIFLTMLVFVLLFNLNLDRLESVFYDYGIVATKELNPELEKFFYVNIDQVSSDYLGDFYPFSNQIFFNSLLNIIKNDPKAIVILNEFRNFNYEDKKQLNLIAELLNSFSQQGGRVVFKQKIDSWGMGDIPEEFKQMNFLPSIIHRDGNTFGHDSVTRRAVVSIGGNETLEFFIAKLLNGNLDQRLTRGDYYNEIADANFALLKFSKNAYLDQLSNDISFYKTISDNNLLENIKGKIVLIGTSIKSNSGDYKLIPGGKKISNLKVLSEIITNLSMEKTISMLPRWVSLLFALAVSLIMILIVFYKKPSTALIVFILTTVFIISLNFFVLSTSSYYLRVSETLIVCVVTYYLCTPFRSILENKRNFALREETRILKEVDELKRNFVSLMSHDLKTPVAKISSVVELLKIENQDRQIYEELSKIEKSTDQLNDFISSILDLTKMESSSLELDLKTVDLNKLVEKVCVNLGDQIKQNNIILTKNLDVLFPITIDEKLTVRVINNLLENAIKYSDKGSLVEITTLDMGDKIKLCVKDNGFGIDENEIKFVFEKFYRVKNDEIPGNGLGLYLVKYFVELMKGEITVTSSLGKGTEFTVFFKNS